MELVNRVAQSGLITVNLEQFFPENEIISFDLKDYLFKEMILKEKDFRTALKEIDWMKFQDSILIIYCSNNAIIPIWAYMLIASYAEPFCKDIFVGTKKEYLNHYYKTKIDALSMETYIDQKIVIKGCSGKPVPEGAYQYLTSRLRPFAKSIMFGEPCSTVPIYKQPMKRN